MDSEQAILYDKVMNQLNMARTEAHKGFDADMIISELTSKSETLFVKKNKTKLNFEAKEFSLIIKQA